MQIQASANNKKKKPLYVWKQVVQVGKGGVRELWVLSVTQNKLSKRNALETGTKGRVLSPFAK